MKYLNIISYEIMRNLAAPIYRLVRGIPNIRASGFEPDIPIRRAKKILRTNGLGFDDKGIPRWWYTAFDGRNTNDQLTQAELNYIINNIPKEADILVTGCGVGLTTIWLAQKGYTKIEGFDYLDNVVLSAKQIARLANVKIKYWQADGFKPGLTKNYDCITALHWVYSAWMGNYGNTPVVDGDREKILTQFLQQYSPHLNSGGVMLIELINAHLDYSYPPYNDYPIRQNFEQVRKAAELNNLFIKQIVTSLNGYRPSVILYVLQKMGS